MKLYRKLICALLLAATLFGLVACSGGGEPGKTETKPSGTKVTDESVTTEEPRNDIADLPEDLNFGEEKFTIRSLVQQPASKEFEAEQNGSVIDQAVYGRNRGLEEKYHCVILSDETVGDTNKSTMLKETEEMVNGGFYNNQILVTAGYRMCDLAINGLLTNIRTMDGISLSKDYYSQGHNEALSFANDYQYLITGRMSMSFYRYLTVMFYNRTLFRDYGVEDPYDLVMNQKWTFEKAAEIASAIHLDNGNVNDSIYGFVGYVGGGSSQTDGFMSAVDMRVVGKDENDCYKLMFDSARLDDTVSKILKLLHSNGSYVSDTWEGGGNVAVPGKFTAGTAGMIAFRLYAVESGDMVALGNTGLGYGILPLPKADEIQDDYVSYVQDQCFLFGFPKTLPDELKQKVGWFFEAYASDSYEMTKTTYYEKALTRRYLDAKSKTIMETIDSKVYVDPVNVYLSSQFKFTTARLRKVYNGESSVTEIVEKYITGTDNLLESQVNGLNEIYGELK